MNSVGLDNIQQRIELLEYGTERLLEIEGLKICMAAIKLCDLFNIEGFIHDIGTYDKLGIAV
jgi:cysteine desulfurase/selenocysteine lyase